MENLMLPITIALAILVITLFVLYFQTRKTLKKLTSGKTGQDLESVIINNNTQIQGLDTKQKQLTESLTALQKDFRKSIQKIGIIRFNPFRETGGNQSFAIALTDQENNGVVISSLYSRERLNVFAKPLENGTSSFPLSDEEQQAIKEACSN